jgi:hypothetical protein
MRGRKEPNMSKDEGARLSDEQIKQAAKCIAMRVWGMSAINGPLAGNIGAGLRDAEREGHLQYERTPAPLSDAPNHLVRDSRTLCGLTQWIGGNVDIKFGIEKGITTCVRCLREAYLDTHREGAAEQPVERNGKYAFVPPSGAYNWWSINDMENKWAEVSIKATLPGAERMARADWDILLDELAPVRDALANTRQIFGVEPYSLPDALQHAAGILDAVKGEWAEAWSEHDQRVRAGLSLALAELAQAQKAAPDGR